MFGLTRTRTLALVTASFLVGGAVLAIRASRVPPADAHSAEAGLADGQYRDAATGIREASVLSNDRTLPEYDAEGNLLRPEGFYEWVLVGASLGLSYSDRPRRDGGPGMFHNVYLEPGAYRHFEETGEFPEKTMLAMTLYAPGEKVSPSQKGYFEGEFLGLEIALKDHERFEEGWVYVPFIADSTGKMPERSSPLPKETGCYECHETHAAYDNVFLQFYPVLRRLRRGDPSRDTEGSR
jgi:hypothetical protein